MEKEIEIFKPIKDYEEYYQISNWGRVKSLAKTWSVGRKGDSILKPGHKTVGYDFVVLCVDKVKKYPTIHRLVALHFCDNPNNYNVVNHLDSDICNNYYKNLEWTTSSGNAIHAFKNGRRAGMKGNQNGQAKLKETDVLKIRTLFDSGLFSNTDISKIYGCRPETISKIGLRQRWTHI